MKRPTQKDVAELAGVSRGTVSMVLNGSTNGRVPISEETRRRVLEAAAKIGYAPNPVAQMLAKGQNHIVGVFVYADVFPYAQSDYYFPYLSGIQQSAIRQNYNVLLFTQNHHQDALPQVYENSMNTLRLADGCIFMGQKTDREELARLHSENYPFVYVGRREIPNHEINYVINDYAAGTAEVAQHLIDLGHRKLGFVANLINFEPEYDKIRGCHTVVDNYPEASVTTFSFGKQQHADLVEQVQQKHITAVLCTDDSSFITTLKLFEQANIRIPEDVSIVCLTTAEYDQSLGLQPTHLYLNRPGIGEKAVEVLIKLIDGELESPQQIMMPTVFVAGETTGPCPT